MPNPAPRTFDGKRAQALYEDGHGCNAIARELGCSPSTVSKWAKENHLLFDRSQTALAVRAHVVDMAESRTLLAQKLLVIAHDLADSVDKPYMVFAFGGRDNDYNEHELDRPPVEAVRNIVTTAAIAFDKASKVLESTPEGLSAAEALIDRLVRDISGVVARTDG